MYLSKELAIKFRDHWADDLKLKIPTITRMGVRLSETPGDHYLEIGISGVTRVEDILANPDGVLVAGSLPAPPGHSSPGPLTVRFVTTGSGHRSAGGTWTGDAEPLRGGHAVARGGESRGTLGCLVRLRRNGKVDNTNTFFLSCWHVLSGPDVQPSAPLEWAPRNAGLTKTLGVLYWSACSEDFDAAIGLIYKDDVAIGEGFAWSRIGVCATQPGVPEVGQAVIVCGHESNEGQERATIQSIHETVWDDYGNKFTNQIMTDRACKRGDSGAILFLDSSPPLVPVGMAFHIHPPQGGDDKGRTYYNNLQTLFSTPFSRPTHENCCNDESFKLEQIIV